MIRSDSLEEAPKRDFNNTTSFTPPYCARVYARFRRFSFFAFTSSPMEDNQLMYNALQVKASLHASLHRRRTKKHSTFTHNQL